MTLREQEEYTALRATIRERGTTRVWVFTLGIAVWAALTLATFALALAPVSTVVPLLALASSFEGVLALHVGVERIGRYLLVFHDDTWEQTAGSFGRPAGAVAVDPLFTAPYIVAAVLTFLPVMTTPDPIRQELIVVLAGQAAFIARVLVARTACARQRDVDTARLRELKNL